MDLLRIIHDDFTLTVESTQFQRMWDKGLGFLGREGLFSTYHWGEGGQERRDRHALLTIILKQHLLSFTI